MTAATITTKGQITIRASVIFSFVCAAFASSEALATQLFLSNAERFTGAAVIEFRVVDRVVDDCWKVKTVDRRVFELSFETDLKGRNFLAVLPRKLVACYSIDFWDNLVFEVLGDERLLEACHETGTALLDFKGLTGSRFPGMRMPGDCRSWIRFDLEEARHAIHEEWMTWNKRAMTGALSLPEISQEARK